MRPYTDRGIIKYSPFDGLAGFVDMMQELRYRLNKKPKPELQEDKLEDMDRIMKSAIQDNKQVTIMYLDDGYVYEYKGFITKLDEINRLLFIDKIKYEIKNVIDIIIE